jgi:phosphatidylinositol-3-phosphatase
MLAISALLLSTSLSMATSSPTRTEAPSSVDRSTPLFPTPIRHVITILLENENLETALQQGSFEDYLVTHYGFASHFYAACHPSAPNYLAITSGDTLQCGTDAYEVHSEANIADLVQGAGLTWGAYEESMPAPCYTADSGNYIAHHDPFISYANIVNNASRCTSHVMPLSAWNSSVAAGTIPNYVFITPNVLDDGHDTGVTFADHWLRNWLSPLLNESLFQSSVFFIVYDESKNLNTGFQGFDGGPVYFAAVGPDVIMNSTYSANVTDYNLLTTTEWLLGLGSLGHNDNWTDFPPMRSLFRVNSTTPPATLYEIAGVTTMANSSKVAGATIYANTTTNSSVAQANATGGFNISLPNGTYVLTAIALSCSPSSKNVTIAGAPDLNLTLVLSPRLYAFQGLVINSTSSAPISNASVFVNSSAVPQHTTSSSTGDFTLDLSAGTYSLEISAYHYKTLNSTLAVGPSNLTATYALQSVGRPLFTVHVTINLANQSAPVPNATIIVAIPNGSESVTARNGSAELSLPNGTYEAVVEAPGLAPAVLRITVNGAAETIVHVTLDNITIGAPAPGLAAVPIVTLTSVALAVLLAPGWFGFVSTARRGSTLRSHYQRPR